MDAFNSIDEILDFAINDEEEAAVLYLEIADRMEAKAMREVFLELVEEEKLHKQKLLDVKAGKLLAPFAKKVVDLRISDYVCTPAPSINMTFQEALVVAMKAEKAAYRLYTDLAKQAENPDFATLFEGLAREEAVHKLRIELLYERKFLDE